MMPKLNKCIHKSSQHGFTHFYRGNTHFSTRDWFSCNLLLGSDGVIYPQSKCRGWNCGSYEEEGD